MIAGNSLSGVCFQLRNRCPERGCLTTLAMSLNTSYPRPHAACNIIFFSVIKCNLIIPVMKHIAFCSQPGVRPWSSSVGLRCWSCTQQWSKGLRQSHWCPQWCVSRRDEGCGWWRERVRGGDEGQGWEGSGAGGGGGGEGRGLNITTDRRIVRICSQFALASQPQTGVSMYGYARINQHSLIPSAAVSSI